MNQDSDPRSSDEGYGASLKLHEGTYQSPWWFLSLSSRSNLRHAIHYTSTLMKVYAEEAGQQTNRGKLYFEMTTAYERLLSGPLLGSIIFAAAAIEAFLRIARRAFLEKDFTKEEGGRGTKGDVVEELKKFDRSSAFGKLRTVYEEMLGQDCPRELREEFNYLFQFRNSCFHSDPILRLGGGCDETTILLKGKFGSTLVDDERGQYPEYPLLWASNRPLSLTHALRAVRVHDQIVKTLLNHSELSYVREAIEDIEVLIEQPADLNSAFPGTEVYEYLDDIAQEWDNSVELALRLVPEKEKARYMTDLTRRLTLHPVK